MIITTEEAKKYLKVNSSLNEANFNPFIPDAEEKYIKPFLGDQLFELLNTWAETKDEAESPELAALYPYVLAAAARFTMLLATPHLNLNIGEAGFGVVSTANIAPASKERVADFKTSTEQLAWDNIENMLRFLEVNKNDYLEWVESEAFTMQTKNLINSAVEFDKYVDIDKSRLTFHRMRQHITNIETLHVITLISKEQFDVFIEKIRDEEPLTDKEKELLRHLRGFVANHVATKYLKMDLDAIAAFHYAEARSLINKFPTDFPAYANSSLYDGATKPFTVYNNTEDSAIFSAII
jgi:hypothetical protein